METTDNAPGVTTEGEVIHWAAHYDRMFRIVTLGREARLRRRMVEAAGIEPGDRVLDVGCGTGTLTLAAAERVGSTGEVVGIDPSAEMIERARGKLHSSGRAPRFEHAAIEALPFEPASFDKAISSLVFHHLTPLLQRVGLKEIRRVLAPGGRLTIVDFFGGGPWLHRLAAHAGGHTEHGLEQLESDTLEAGFERVEIARIKPRFLHRFSAEVPRD